MKVFMNEGDFDLVGCWSVSFEKILRALFVKVFITSL